MHIETILLYDERMYGSHDRRPFKIFDNINEDGWPWPVPPQVGLQLAFRVKTEDGRTRKMVCRITKINLKSDVFWKGDRSFTTDILCEVIKDETTGPE